MVFPAGSGWENGKASWPEMETNQPDPSDKQTELGASWVQAGCVTFLLNYLTDSVTFNASGYPIVSAALMIFSAEWGQLLHSGDGVGPDRVTLSSLLMLSSEAMLPSHPGILISAVVYPKTLCSLATLEEGSPS